MKTGKPSYQGQRIAAQAAAALQSPQPAVMVATQRWGIHAPVSPVTGKLKELGVQVEINFDPTNFEDTDELAQRAFTLEEFTSTNMKLMHDAMLKDDANNRRSPTSGNPDIRLSFTTHDGSQVCDVYVRHRLLGKGPTTELFAVFTFYDRTMPHEGTEPLARHADGSTTPNARYAKEVYYRDMGYMQTSQLLDVFLFTAGLQYELFVADALLRRTISVLPRK